MRDARISKLPTALSVRVACRVAMCVCVVFDNHISIETGNNTVHAGVKSPPHLQQQWHTYLVNSVRRVIFILRAPWVGSSTGYGVAGCLDPH